MTKNIYVYVILLNGIVLENEVEVFQGVRLVPFPSTLGKKRENIPRNVSEWYPAAGSIRYFLNKTQLIIDSSAASDFNCDYIEQLCQALSLSCNSDIQVATTVPVRIDKKPFDMVPYVGPAETLIQHDPVKESDIEEAKRLYKLLDSLEPDVQRKLHIPINRWIKSHVLQSAMEDKMIDLEVPPEKIAEAPTTRDVDKMIDLGIAFESMYLSSVSKLSHHLSNRASKYLAENQDEQEELKKIFKEIYDCWRSKAVHNGRLPTENVKIGEKVYTPSDLIKQTQNLCRRSILKILEDPRPRVILNLDKEYLRPLLENGCKFRKSKDYLKCRLRFTDGRDCQLHALIPPGGISKKGYIKEVWIECIAESVEIDNQSYDLMTPYIHSTKQRIQEFILDSDNSIKLLPNPDEIAIKYFQVLPSQPE